MIIQVRRGTTAQAAVHVGREGSFFLDLDLKALYVHDGVTAGGSPVGGLSAEAVQALIDASLLSHEVAIDKVTGLTEALAATVKETDIGEKVASLVEGKVPADQLPAPVDVPEKATGAELIAGLDDTKFATAASLLALLTDIGFTKDGDGKWSLDQGTVTP